MRVDDTLAVFHTHAVAGLLGGVLTGLLATPELLEIESLVPGRLLRLRCPACFVCVVSFCRSSVLASSLELV
jgi:ammonia channel protein AmtB